jgi:hypothetical protein
MVVILEDFAFADGTIDRWSFGNDELILHFTDNQLNQVILRFVGDVEVGEQGSINGHIIGSRLDRAGDRRTLRLREEDWGVVLTITFRECEIIPS